jgi:hypothetical protein
LLPLWRFPGYKLRLAACTPFIVHLQTAALGCRSRRKQLRVAGEYLISW